MLQSQKRIFLISIAFAAAATGIFFSILSNYLYEIYQVDAEGRGFLEFFREMPGVLTVLFLAAIVVMREKYIMIVAALIIAASVVGLAYMPSQYWAVVIFIFMWSVGAHINLVLHQTYGVALSGTAERGKLFGAVGGVRGIGYILGTGVVWIGMGYLGMGFGGAFIAAGIFSIIAAIGYCFLKPHAHTARRRRRLVLKKEYTLFYVLAVLFGFRKQIFLVFAPWVLVRIFGLPAQDIALMMLMAAAVGIFGKPLLGVAIDRYGERRVLAADACVLIFVCAGYGLAPHYFSPIVAVPVLFGLYIVDDLLFSLRSAHTTYLSKIAKNHDELTSTISVSFAIEHVVSMTGPIVAGIVWVHAGFSWVFAIAGAVAILMLVAALRIPHHGELLRRAREVEEGEMMKDEL